MDNELEELLQQEEIQKIRISLIKKVIYYLKNELNFIYRKKMNYKMN